MWFEDLAECTYFPFKDTSRLLSVGWLERGKPFNIGEIDQEVFERLCELTQNPWSPVGCAGVHHCELCRFTQDSVGFYLKKEGNINTIRYEVSAASKGVSLFVPGTGVLYVSPTSITHYIDAHGYCPPAEFCESVLRCPPMRSMAYLKAILANGGRKWGIKFSG